MKQTTHDNSSAHDLNAIVQILQRGGIIAYPTEAVFGLGCDPLNEQAVANVFALKGRPMEKGVILIAADWPQLEPLVESVDNLDKILASWPGPHTWVFQANDALPDIVCGPNRTIAVRVTDHPIAKQLARAFGGPIVSTSANPSNQLPARDAATVKRYFGDKVDAVIAGDVGDLTNPTTIRNAKTGDYLRK